MGLRLRTKKNRCARYNCTDRARWFVRFACLVCPSTRKRIFSAASNRRTPFATSVVGSSRTSKTRCSLRPIRLPSDLKFGDWRADLHRFKIEDEGLMLDKLAAWACIRLDRLQPGYRFIDLKDARGKASAGKLLVKIEKVIS